MFPSICCGIFAVALGFRDIQRLVFVPSTFAGQCEAQSALVAKRPPRVIQFQWVSEWVCVGVYIRDVFFPFQQLTFFAWVTCVSCNASADDSSPCFACVWGLQPDEMPEVSTIDRYQGAENQIVIVSLVRSNKEKKIGFLGTEDGKNRMTVAQSRAKRGLYLIGNVECLRGAPHWQAFIDMLQERDSVAVGDRFPQICPRHPEINNPAQEAENVGIALGLQCYSLSCFNTCFNTTSWAPSHDMYQLFWDAMEVLYSELWRPSLGYRDKWSGPVWSPHGTNTVLCPLNLVDVLQPVAA